MTKTTRQVIELEADQQTLFEALKEKTGATIQWHLRKAVEEYCDRLKRQHKSLLEKS